MTARDVNGICKKLGIRRKDLESAQEKISADDTAHYKTSPDWDSYEHAKEILTPDEFKALALYYPSLQIAYPDVFGSFNS